MPCIKQARMKLELTIISIQQAKNFAVLTSLSADRNSSEIKHFFSDFKSRYYNTLSNCKREKCETYCVSKFSIWRQKRVAGVRRGSWFVELGRVIFVLCRRKYAVKLNPKFSSLRLGQGNFSIAPKQDRSSAQLFRPCWDS